MCTALRAHDAKAAAASGPRRNDRRGRTFAVTSHHGGLHQFDPGAPERSGSLQYLFEDTLEAPANIVLSERIRDAYIRSGYGKFLRVLRNGVEADQFRVAPHGNGKAVCVGLISPRKRQGWLAELTRGRVPIDFVGPWTNRREGDFAENQTARYVGVWDKPTLYERLTDYSCFVLLSHSEAAPKVVPEALAAGLSLVLSEACTANLTREEFITVIPDGEAQPEVIANAIQTAIDRNGMHRDAMRRYANEKFDYDVLVPEYVQMVEEIREYFVRGAECLVGT